MSMVGDVSSQAYGSEAYAEPMYIRVIVSQA